MNYYTKIKFCGIKKKSEIDFLSNFGGVDFLGFVFYKKSKRYINLKNAILLINSIKFFYKVGVFVNPSKKYILKILKNVNLNLIQYNGEEKINFCEDIKKITNVPYIKVNRINKISKKTIKKFNRIEDKYLFLDSNKHYGGKGVMFNWKNLEKINNKKIIVSGGLDYKNVKKLVRKYKPYCVDVSTGIEINNRKSIKLMKKFINSVKNET
ncbi:phosphoribosylanthranilate isomerase [Candidatus Vidania fulgoroideorum]